MRSSGWRSKLGKGRISTRSGEYRQVWLCMYGCRHVCMYEWMPIIGRWRVSTFDCTRMEVEFPLRLDSLPNECTAPYYLDTPCLSHAPFKCMYVVMHPLRDPRQIRGIYRISGGFFMYVCWCMHVYTMYGHAN